MRNRILGALGAVLLVLVGVVWAAPRFSNTHGAPAIHQAYEFDLAPPGADTDALTTALSPNIKGSVFRVSVALTTASVFNVSATDGTTTHVWGLNGSNALTAGDLYTFQFGVDSALDYNFQVETDGTLEFLGVQEVVGE